jgi:hypothetical protein
MKTFRQFIIESSFTFLDVIKKSGKLGSNDGGVFVNPKTGGKFYYKHYESPHQGKVEALTSKIYNHMGIHTLNPEVSHEHENTVTSAWNEHVKTEKPEFYDNVSKKHANQLGKMYHAAILTKNWDIVGLEHDNILHNHKTGDLHAIDHGGAMNFRARGGLKEYGPDIAEKETLRSPPKSDGTYPSQSGRVFNSVFKQHPDAEHHGLEAVKKIDDNHIHHLFKTSGLSNWKELHSNFVKRKKALIDSYK